MLLLPGLTPCLVCSCLLLGSCSAPSQGTGCPTGVSLKSFLSREASLTTLAVRDYDGKAENTLCSQEHTTLTEEAPTKSLVPESVMGPFLKLRSELNAHPSSFPIHRGFL